MPHVPGTIIATADTADRLKFEERAEHQARIRRTLETIQEAMRPGTMMRWDYCAGSDLKLQMGLSGDCRIEEARSSLQIDDPRLLEILLTWPRAKLPIVRRPWIKIERNGGWPREYRAYVTDGKLDRISSYYPQRPLGRHESELEKVRDLTERLINNARAPFQWMHGAERVAEMIRTYAEQAQGTKMPSPEIQGVHFTADFVASSTDILLLEGGPPHFLGADLCCFRDGDTDGIALKKRRRDTASQPRGDTEPA